VPNDGLKVAVTGPTGDLGIALVDALERSRQVKKIVGMARRPFDPRDQGWKKTEYRQGDVQDKRSVADAVKGADVVVHLAFAILSASDATRAVNIDGSRNVFEAAVESGAERIAYASSVAAYGFHDDNPDWLTENVDPRGTPEHFYSQQKAEVEAVLAQTLLKTTRTHAWVFRPCIVAGPKAQTLLEELPYFRLSEALPDAVTRLLSSMPILKPVIPDPGTPFQLVHEDDVASAFVAGVHGKGAPGPYNLAGNGTLTMSDLADALGWYSVPLPQTAVGTTADLISRVPNLPAIVAWIHSVRKPVLMKTDRAKKELGWKPQHTSKATLKELVAAYRDEDRVGAN
jgi:nucleoside-diphosphate-sugar epimerase